ncbi:fibronectin type III domain protein, partial [Opisthorchis viverrini]
VDKLPDVRIFVSNVKGSTAQHIEWTSNPTYPRGCDLRFKLTRYAEQLSTQRISQKFVTIQNATTENLLPETTYVYIATVYSQKLGFQYRKSISRKLRTNRVNTTITVKGVILGNGSVKIKWNKVQLGTNVQVRVINNKSEFIVKGTRISSRIENLTACTAYGLWIELMNGKTEINRLWLGNVTTKYPVLESPDGFTAEQLENRMGHRLQWFPVSTNLSLSCRLSYRVTRTTRIHNSTEEKHFTLDATELNLFDLKPNVRYFYKVQAVLNSVHYGRYSDSVRIDTPPKSFFYSHIHFVAFFYSTRNCANQLSRIYRAPPDKQVYLALTDDCCLSYRDIFHWSLIRNRDGDAAEMVSHIV